MRRALLHFLWIGVALFVADRVLFAAAAPVEPIVISDDRLSELKDRFLGRMGRLPESGELDALIQVEVDDELLYRAALAHGFDRGDPVIQRRLVQNMRFAGAPADADDAALYAEALELGMDRRDPVVRRRLVQRMRLEIEASALEPEPTEEELRAVYAADPEQHLRPARIRFHQRYFTSTERAEAAGAQLPPDGPTDALAVGDPFLHGAQQPLQSKREIAQRFGAEFADGVFELRTGTWSAPIASAYGSHRVWVSERQDASLAPFEAVRERVGHILQAERRERALKQALEALRAQTQVVAGP